MAVASEILIWNKDMGFIRITEGSGDNLLREDIAEGYVDYINIDGMEFDGYELVENDELIDGGMCMLTELYQDIFHTPEEVVEYLIDAEFVPATNYMILYPV